MWAYRMWAYLTATVGYSFFWLRRMHWLMIFIGSVSVVIAGNGLKEILISTFAGSNEMLLGKNSL